MKAMGIPIWATRSCSVYDDCLSTRSISEQVKHEHPHAPSALNLIDSLDEATPQTVTIAESVIATELQSTPSAVSNPVEHLEWSDMQTAVAQCQQCDIHRFRTQAVLGSGNTSASWMIVGEAPDFEEDTQGLPFLGKAGQLLDNILTAIALDRESVYLANIIKCRPPNDRDPHVDEIANCMGYLHRQIELVQPKVIVAVGRLAAQQLLQSKKPIGQMRGQVHRLPKTNTPLIVTYHPRYLLRQSSEKSKVWEDIKLARSIVQA